MKMVSTHKKYFQKIF